MISYSIPPYPPSPLSFLRLRCYNDNETCDGFTCVLKQKSSIFTCVLKQEVSNFTCVLKQLFSKIFA